MPRWSLRWGHRCPVSRKSGECGIDCRDGAGRESSGQSEEFLWRALKPLAVRRDETVVATKLFYAADHGANRGGLSRKRIMQAVDESLVRLGMDYIDLYQVHRFDYETPIEETIAALDDRSEEHTSELQSLMRISYAVFCLKKQPPTTQTITKD